MAITRRERRNIMINDWLSADADRISRILYETSTSTLSAGGFGMKNRVSDFIKAVRTALYPNIYHDRVVEPEFLRAFRYNRLSDAAILLYGLCCDLCSSACRDEIKHTSECDNCRERAEETVRGFLDSLPEISLLLATDVKAAYEGDPAAISEDEIMLAYPAFEAISIYRLAHRLYSLGVPLLPRMMTEQAHAKTGIDIHPGATVGKSFFIDHGTGVVIGETCVIGDRVKLYQGVTLGAKSFENDENGNPVKGIKRHPNIGNDVVIYAGATILGGETFIGDGCVIGGNVWLTRSTAPGTSVVYEQGTNNHF